LEVNEEARKRLRKLVDESMDFSVLHMAKMDMMYASYLLQKENEYLDTHPGERFRKGHVGEYLDQIGMRIKKNPDFIPTKEDVTKIVRRLCIDRILPYATGKYSEEYRASNEEIQPSDFIDIRVLVPDFEFKIYEFSGFKDKDLNAEGRYEILLLFKDVDFSDFYDRLPDGRIKELFNEEASIMIDDLNKNLKLKIDKKNFLR
jgi:hypothetical protein